MQNQLLLPRPRLDGVVVTSTRKQLERPATVSFNPIPPLVLPADVKVGQPVQSFFVVLQFSILDDRLIRLVHQRRLLHRQREDGQPVSRPALRDRFLAHYPQKAHGLRGLCQPSEPGAQEERAQGLPVHHHGRR